MAQQLSFDPATHTYTLDGVIVTSVSELIAPLKSTPDDSLENVIEAAAERGVICHAILEDLLSGGDASGIECPDAYSGYVDAILLFLSEHFIDPLAIERPVASAFLRLAGTPDLLCLFDGMLAILDYKFVSSVDKTAVKAQLNAYRMIYAEQRVYPDELYAVQFLSDGKYRLYPVAVDNTEVDLCLAMRDARAKKHPRGHIA